jgi:Uma2 family endonuclease
MTALPKLKLSPAEYLAREERAETRSEFFAGEIFAMAGASIEHNQIKENLSGELFSRLKSSSCRAFSSDQRLKVDPTGLYTYPDLMIVCGPIERDPLSAHTIVNPTVLIEVLSPSTEAYDRGAKFLQYQKIPSVREIVLVGEFARVVQVFERQEDGSWSLRTFADQGESVRLSSVSVEIPMSDVFRGIDSLTAADSQPSR